jgi:hypothetical protein
MRDLVVAPRILARPITGAVDYAASGFFACFLMHREDLMPAPSNMRTPTSPGGGEADCQSGLPIFRSAQTF